MLLVLVFDDLPHLQQNHISAQFFTPEASNCQIYENFFLKVSCFTYECFVQTLRRQFVGALPLSEQERHAQLLQQLREDKREAESIKERARRDQERVQVGNSLYSNISLFICTILLKKKKSTSLPHD